MGSSSTKIAPDQDVKWVSTSRGVQLGVKYIQPSAFVARTDIASLPDNEQECEPKQMNIGKTKAIFFIHGVAGCSEIWLSQMSYFAARGYHVIAIDLLGHGVSSAPDNPSLYRFEHMSADCVDVFDQMNMDVNIVVAHSYGTSLATYLARNRSSKIDKLVLMSGGAPVPLAPQAGILSLPSMCLSVIKPILTGFFHRNAFHKKNKNLPNKDRAFAVPVHVLRHTMKGQVWEEGDEHFHKLITQPTLLLHGVDDKLESFEGTVEMQKTLQRSEIFTIANASHMIMMEQPDLVNSLIDTFLNSDQVIPTNISSENLVAQKISTSHTHMTKSQPNLRRATITS